MPAGGSYNELSSDPIHRESALDPCGVSVTLPAESASQPLRSQCYTRCRVSITPPVESVPEALHAWPRGVLWGLVRGPDGFNPGWLEMGDGSHLRLCPCPRGQWVGLHCQPRVWDWVPWPPAPTLRGFPKSPCYITKDTFMALSTGNSKGFRDSLPGTWDTLLVRNPTITTVVLCAGAGVE